MLSSLRAIDYFETLAQEKNVMMKDVKFEKKIFVDYLVSYNNYLELWSTRRNSISRCSVAVILSIIFILIKRLKFKMEKLVILSNEKPQKII